MTAARLDVRMAYPPASGRYERAVIDENGRQVFGPASLADCEAWIAKLPPSTNRRGVIPEPTGYDGIGTPGGGHA